VWTVPAAIRRRISETLPSTRTDYIVLYDTTSILHAWRATVIG